jgi:CHASE2 domain-containing sensor protein/two-component sensor histidine kinase
LQFLELVTLDQFLRLRPAEPRDERIVIVGITEEDIQRAKTYPIPDGVIADLIERLQKAKPAVIGLDIVRDLPVEPGHKALKSTFQRHQNLFGIEIALPDQYGLTVAPPPALPPEQVGFADSMLDADGYQRRSLLGAHNPQGEYRFSFTAQVAAEYLAQQGIALENGWRDQDAMRFGTVELNRVKPNTGSYIQADDGGNQILLNVRSGLQPFRVLTLSQIQRGEFQTSWLRDRIVLIGIMSFSAKDLASSGALVGRNPAQIYGIEMQAHSISQITSAVLDERPLLKTWAEGWEYVWIIGWGLVGISLGRFLRSPWGILLGLGLGIILLLGICYGLLLLGWWVPIVPALLPLVLNGVGSTAALFYRHDQAIRLRLEERQFAIQQIFDAIHSQPLQILSKMLREEQAKATPSPLLDDLRRMRHEVDVIFGLAQRDLFDESGQLRIGGDVEFTLQAPLHEVLYKIYGRTMERDLPHFKTIQCKIVQFDALNQKNLKLEHKLALCRFLEEALCNVGKHAVGATRLTVICTQKGNQQVIQVVDNGVGNSIVASLPSTERTKGMGTQLANNLAQQLGGRFRREANSPQGTLCEFTWPVKRGWWRW